MALAVATTIALMQITKTAACSRRRSPGSDDGACFVEFCTNACIERLYDTGVHRPGIQ
jgi:hypothetical protein